MLRKGWSIMTQQSYYQKDIETMSREEMKTLQSEKLVKQVKHVYENVPYYRNLMDEKGVSIIADMILFCFGYSLPERKVLFKYRFKHCPCHMRSPLN